MTDGPPIPEEAHDAASEAFWDAGVGTNPLRDAIEAAYPHIAEAVLHWAAGEIETSANKAIDRQRQRSPRSKRETAIQLRIGHGSAAFLGAAQTLRKLAHEVKEAQA